MNLRRVGGRPLPGAAATATLAQGERADGAPLGRGQARANANIALIKYWGKADEDLIIPRTSSLSLTLDGLSTRTDVEFLRSGAADGPAADSLTIDDEPKSGKPLERVSRFLDVVRAQAGIDAPARVCSYNTVPYGAGLASSSSAFAALAGAACAAAGLELSNRELSRLARRGSGSACRSIYGGLVKWEAGHDDASSYAVPVESDLDLALIVVLVSGQEKTVSSRLAMRRTVETSPLYQAWAEQSAVDLDEALAAIRARDLERLGELVEANALGMHAAMLAARPAICYWRPETLRVFEAVRAVRADGLGAWSTLDAGPNLKVLTGGGQAAAVADQLRARLPGVNIQVHRAGPGLRIMGMNTDEGRC
ncbi:diphosphomevalonate decarboxylase [Bifidobacterium actinocoloniiforme DSM 22766]|uniref:diphosphomevalonate decarboxylase n=1 Tax=Bifidobacterium actinocoloniiforme DSM 22766 TaxID=1437605 RepID=A0A086YYC6_9BIFI|nr:diphosphomevalonate decarboxylase [Bifidobacterium actinocoloniiforme]KFI39276.1 diphosphomevalonate decarboxylase [Bifidobacterium actinocoloniiforme DSM 22766]